MLISWVAAAVASAAATKAAVDYYEANQQKKKAREMEKNLVRPKFEIPESDKRALESAEAQANMRRLPNQSAIEGRIDQTTANKIAMIERMGIGGTQGINAASRAYGQQMDAENELGIAAGNMYLRNQDVYRDELRNMGDLEMQEWAWNHRLPYEQQVAAIMALKEAGIRNERAARDDFYGSASAFGGSAAGRSYGGGNNGNAKTAPAATNSGNSLYVTDPNQRINSNTSIYTDPNYGRETLPGNQRQNIWGSWDTGGIR